MKYIATREGVEILEGTGDPTPKQKELIENILRDFPDAKELFEYRDYRNAPCVRTASAFISTALDYNAEDVQSSEIYMRYIATRPGAEKHGGHGLFSAAETTDLDSAMWMMNKHEGNVWTFIYSLRREDAARLGYDNAESWRSLLLSLEPELVTAMRISPGNLKWYAAYHDADSHPHIHMMVWSMDPQEGCLSKQGMEAMRSKLTNTIFKDEMYSLYEQKDISYKELKEAAQTSIRELIAQMENSMCSSPVIEQRMTELVQVLSSAKGKKQYGYLKKPVKEIVDAIVDELAKQPEVAQCYEAWNSLRDELESYYKDRPREHLPLSRQKEFKAIKNMVIREAENIRLGVQIFEDEKMDDDPELELPIMEEPERKSVRDIVYGREEEPSSSKVEQLEYLWQLGYTNAAHKLGKLYRDGQEVVQDYEKAKQWFTLSAQAGNGCSEYALGKMLLSQGKTKDGFQWLVNAANHGNSYAMYRIGKELLTGEHIAMDPDNAVNYFEAAARRGNQYAQYVLGKILLQGKDVPADKETALQWLELSAAQGNPYVQYLVDHADDGPDTSTLLSASRLLHHMGRVFRSNYMAPSSPQGPRVDSRQRRKLQEKRIALGHKEDAHEEYVPTQNWQQTM